jgi:protein ImuA
MMTLPDIQPGDPAAGLPFPFGLGRAGVHELAEAGFGDYPALTGFALAAVREAGRAGACLWIRQAAMVREHGRLSGRGLASFGFDPGRLLLVEAKTRLEALRATEEACRARDGLAVVIAELDDMDFTASRRLGLACQAGRTPLVLMFPHMRSGATAAAGRWRVSARPSAPDPYDARAPGRPVWRAVLEKSRLRPGEAGQVFDVEFHHETPCLRLVPGLAARPSAPQPRRVGAGEAGVWRHAG